MQSETPELTFDGYDSQSYTADSASIDDLANHFQSVITYIIYHFATVDAFLSWTPKWVTSRTRWSTTVAPWTCSTPNHHLYRNLLVLYSPPPCISHIVIQLNYHLYTQPRPEALQYKYIVSDEIREELQRRTETLHSGPPPGLNLPDEIQGYHSLTPLEPVSGERRKFGNWYSAVYKAVNTTDGFTYVLRRIESTQVNLAIVSSISDLYPPSTRAAIKQKEGKGAKHIEDTPCCL